MATSWLNGSPETVFAEPSDLGYDIHTAEQTGEWQYSGLPTGADNVSISHSLSTWTLSFDVGGSTQTGTASGSESAVSLTFSYTISGGTVTVSANKAYELHDRAVNIVTLGSSVTTAAFQFPSISNQAKSRDFFLRLIIQGSTAPTVGFVESDGTSPVAFDADDDSWSDIEPGVNILMFTDTSR